MTMIIYSRSSGRFCVETSLPARYAGVITPVAGSISRVPSWPAAMRNGVIFEFPCGFDVDQVPLLLWCVGARAQVRRRSAGTLPEVPRHIQRRAASGGAYGCGRGWDTYRANREDPRCVCLRRPAGRAGQCRGPAGQMPQMCANRFHSPANHAGWAAGRCRGPGRSGLELVGRRSRRPSRLVAGGRCRARYVRAPAIRT